MFPVSDVIPSRTRPYVTLALIAANTAAFAAELLLGDRLPSFVFAYGLVPAHFSWPDVLTGMFLHGGWVHFVGNMLYLWIFGDNVEDRLGHARYAAFYVACGAAAAIAHVAVHPDSTIPTIGASGAISGVMGAYFVLYPRSRVLTAVFLVVFMDLVEIPAIFFLGVWFLMQVFSGVGSIGVPAGDVAVWSHIAGFVAGAAAGAVWRLRGTRWQIDPR